MPSPRSTPPELLAPAGDWDCAKAAVENGADAVYFGLRDGFNARGRAANFAADELPGLMAFLRARGVRGYLTLNTLVFQDELDQIEQTARKAIAAGVDAVLVQDLGLLRLLGRLCPELPLHASTQMTLSSAECIREVESLGVRRVVLPRELSIDEIAAIHRQTDMELEVFVHGALCISYSGQCLASLSMGGRSANRGQCAQPCRLPYEVICHGRQSTALNVENTHFRYPLSPNDLAAYELLPELIAAGAAALKIEGRLKPPQYVAAATHHYRDAIDAIFKRQATAIENDVQNVADLELSFSRGFCRGWLDGADQRGLVSGQSSANRGVLLGEVRGVRGGRILVDLAIPVRRGDGVVFEGDRAAEAEQGGRIYEIFRNRRSVPSDPGGNQVELAFRHGAINLEKIELGQKIWKTDDPQASRRLRQSYASNYARRRMPVDLEIEARVGERLRILAAAASGVKCRIESPDVLPEAVKRPITSELLAAQLGRLGKTPYQLRQLEVRIEGAPMIPLSVLGKLRHEMVRQLDAAAAQPPQRTVAEGSVLKLLREQSKQSLQGNSIQRPILHILCRRLEQIEAALQCGVTNLIAELADFDLCSQAVQKARAGVAKIMLASPRIHKPGESSIFERLAELRPDGILARNLAALAFFRRLELPVVADFSLNAVNELSVDWLLQEGADRVTAAYDLNPKRLVELAAAVPAGRLEVVVHRHTPMFHTEYCMFRGIFSPDADRSGCGRICRRTQVRLRDRRGVEHLLQPDSQCRNTVFHAEAESFADIAPGLLKQGVCHFRVELLDERRLDEIRRVLNPYRQLCGAS